MTREEIIQAISDDKMMPFIQPEQLAEIVDFVIKNYKLSLPSNLDEAAQRIAYDVCKQLPNGEEKDGIVYYAILAAIAGAKWMAEQGVMVEAEIEEPEPLYWRILLELPGTFMVDHNLKPGDEVIIQIRKKNE